MQQLFSYIFNIYAQHQVVKESTKFRHINTNTCHTCNVINIKNNQTKKIDFTL